MEIVVIGHLSRDLILTPESRTETIGGGPAYAMIAPKIGALGAGIISCVGEDFEDDYIATLETAGLNVSGIQKRGAKSTRFINEYDEEGRRTQRVECIGSPLSPSDVLPQHMGASIYHFSPLTADEIPYSVIDSVRVGGPLISIDSQGFLRGIEDEIIIEREWPNRDEILALADVVKFDEAELKLAYDSQSELSSVTELLSIGPRMVLVTRDRRGSTVYTRNTQKDIPLVLANAQTDPTGCGDVYVISFLLEYMRTGDVKRAGLFGATCSSFNVETTGPYDLPTREQVERRMKPYAQS
ncbi:MAG: carbohydrate kinase family protein [Candidatus Thorarchaeota archaeon]|jgi:sugar/nucleoside kinase (ribokinase family)